MQYGYIQYMKFGIEIYGDGDRKPWEKKERENWARERGGGGWGYAQWVFLYIYLHYGAFFLARILPFV